MRVPELVLLLLVSLLFAVAWTKPDPEKSHVRNRSLCLSLDARGATTVAPHVRYKA